LSVGTVIASGTIKDSADALVFKQFPTAGNEKTVNLGSMVDIWITDDPDAIINEDELDN